jgi:NADPH-dependent 2,4-dienoyl-CoA reductase/sulfur reductase-like enzyme
MQRRSFLKSIGSLAMISSPALVWAGANAAPHVVVVGAGFGGATAAKYLRIFGQGQIRVTIIEPNASFVSCPISALVLEGALSMNDITHTYSALQQRHGITLVKDSVASIDAAARTVRLESGSTLAWDRLILSPGIDFLWESIPGMNDPEAQQTIMHAWRAGDQVQTLRKQLEAMPDGGRFIISIPETPYRCPPAPYERACLVASYFKKHKPRSKVHIFDANADLTSKGALFKAVWRDTYPHLIEYEPNFKAVDVDVANKTLVFELGEEEKADVVNLIPPMRAGRLAVEAGLATANGRWCEVDFLTFASVAEPAIHVLGDSVQIAPEMPKSGHMANQHGKTCAAAVAALLLGRTVNQEPIYSNTCYSFIDDTHAMHVASVHRYDARHKTMLPVDGAGGLSQAPSGEEGGHAMSWARAIWSDMLA